MTKEILPGNSLVLIAFRMEGLGLLHLVVEVVVMFGFSLFLILNFCLLHGRPRFIHSFPSPSPPWDLLLFLLQLLTA